MTCSHCSGSFPRDLADLTVRELARIRLLNDQLTFIEQWIVAHASTFWHHSVTEIFGVQARVYCVARSGCACSDGKIVMEFDVLTLLKGTQQFTAPLSGQLTRRVTDNLFANMQACHLYRELSERQLPSEWNRLLEIDEIRVELVISRHAHIEPTRVG